MTLAFVASPGAASPVRSPLMSATKTGTPAFESWPASSWSVLVLPVPVAPAMRPWRLSMDSATWTRTSLASSPPCIGLPMTSPGSVERVAGGHRVVERLVHRYLQDGARRSCRGDVRKRIIGAAQERAMSTGTEEDRP